MDGWVLLVSGSVWAATTAQRGQNCRDGVVARYRQDKARQRKEQYFAQNYHLDMVDNERYIG